MSPTPLEDEVHDALRRRVDPLHHASLTVTDVRRRARRIQRRRATTAAAGIVAALAIAVPVGLAINGPDPRTDVPPATRPPEVTGPVRVDPRSAAPGEAPRVPLVDTTGPTLSFGDAVVDLPLAYDQITPYRGGWVAVRNVEGVYALDVLDASFDVIESELRVSRLTVSPDGTRVSWASHDGQGWTIRNTDVAGTEQERQWATLPEGPDGSGVGTIGFVSDDEVLGFRLDELRGTVTTFIATAKEVVELPWIDQAVSATPTTGMIAARATVADGRSCSATFDGRTRSVEPLWTECDRTLGDFNADGSLLAAFPEGDQGSDGPPPGISILDATTGASLVDFEVTGARNRVGGIAQAVWEDEETLVATYLDGDQQYVVRLGLDGSVQRVAGPVRNDDYTLSLRLTPGDPS